MFRHVLVFLRIFEAIAAVWRIYALEVQVPAALARCLAITFDFAALTFVTVQVVSMLNRPLRAATRCLPGERDVARAARFRLSLLSIVRLPLAAIRIGIVKVVLLVDLAVRERSQLCGHCRIHGQPRCAGMCGTVPSSEVFQGGESASSAITNLGTADPASSCLD